MAKVTLMWCWGTTSFGITGVSLFRSGGDETFTDSIVEKLSADNGEGYAARFKFAFQYCGEGDPWWMGYPGFPCESYLNAPASYVELRPVETLSSPRTDGTNGVGDASCIQELTSGKGYRSSTRKRVLRVGIPPLKSMNKAGCASDPVADLISNSMVSMQRHWC